MCTLTRLPKLLGAASIYNFSAGDVRRGARTIGQESKAFFQVPKDIQIDHPNSSSPSMTRITLDAIRVQTLQCRDATNPSSASRPVSSQVLHAGRPSCSHTTPAIPSSSVLHPAETIHPVILRRASQKTSHRGSGETFTSSWGRSGP